jgi:signal peptidase complex subunit 2
VLTAKYEESHSLMDGRLVICGVAVAVAILALIWDYLFPFPESR